ncbi:MAG TPA: HipA domain-containing protein [Solirubrobacterales bacterium]|nr:HipA domain-containing protein [Solirubrobacterales bacterium]
MGSPYSGFAQPLQGALSTCLLKPEFGQYPDLVGNETFCMRIVASSGLEAARVDALEIGSTRCLYVARFDRVLDGGHAIARVHQEDMCQAMGILPAAKYEDNDGPSIPGIVRLLRSLGGPYMARNISDLVQAALVNFLLGNSDAHGKNFALLYEPGSGARLAPLYDIVSTAVYPEVTDRMAMAIGGISDPSRVDLEAWSRLAEECELGRGIGPIVRRRTATVLRALAYWQELAATQGWRSQVVDSIGDVCRARAAQLLDS